MLDELTLQESEQLDADVRMPGKTVQFAVKATPSSLTSQKPTEKALSSGPSDADGSADVLPVVQREEAPTVGTVGGNPFPDSTPSSSTNTALSTMTQRTQNSLNLRRKF